MQHAEFENQKSLRDYADANDLTYVWEGTNAFAKRWQLAQLSRPGQYYLVEVRTKRGITKALLFPKTIVRVATDAPLREALEIKHEWLRAKKSAQKPPPKRKSPG